MATSFCGTVMSADSLLGACRPGTSGHVAEACSAEPKAFMPFHSKSSRAPVQCRRSPAINLALNRFGCFKLHRVGHRLDRIQSRARRSVQASAGTEVDPKAGVPSYKPASFEVLITGKSSSGSIM
jgi:hypothetical protein